MIGKKLSKILAAVMAVAMLGGCGKAQVPSASGGVLKETAPAVTEAPVLNDPGERHYRTFGYYYCIHNDGTVSIRDDDYYESGFTKVTVPGWSDIVSVVYDYRNFVGLKSDGTIVTTAPDDESYQVLKSWKDIVSIHSNDYSDGIIGLSAAGEVFCSADSSVITQWKEIVQLEAQYSGTFGLKADGTVVSEDPAVDLSGWTDVTQLALGSAFVAGLRRDGTVLMAPLYGDYEDPMLEQQMAEVSRWTDVVKLSAYQELMGLRSDGTVLATNAVVGEFAAYFDSDMDFSSWRGVTDIEHWGASFVGLRHDGIVLTHGANEGGQLNVEDLYNIKAVVIEDYTGFALREDGALFETIGYSDSGQIATIVAQDVRCP